MIPFDLHGLVPSTEGAGKDQDRAVFRLLAERLAATGRASRHVLSLTFFVNATDADTYLRRRESLLALVDENFTGAAPPASVVAQPPENGRDVALEAAVLVAGMDARVERRRCDGLPYTVVTGPGITQVHGGGIAAPFAASDPAEQAREAFARMSGILERERLGYGDVVRQWNYIEDMLDLGSASGNGRQAYQAFNDVRSVTYDRTGFPAGYPAATGIGQASGGIVLEFIALTRTPEIRVEPISNPRQVDAHRYSDGVLVGEPIEEVPGRTSPKFERAKLVARGDVRTIFVSGTASIVGEESVAPGDVAAQTRTTIENIALLLGDVKLSYLRAYVKRADDIPTVREVCEAAYGPIPALFVRADVCREELLVELEGAHFARGTR